MVDQVTTDDYLAQLKALLPEGPAWPKDEDTVLHDLLRGIAEEFARVHNRDLDLLQEVNPQTTLEMLEDWERICGLPGDCDVLSDTIAERRANVVNQLRARGGQSLGYFKNIAETIGYPNPKITEFRPFVCGLSEVGVDTLNGDADCRFVWRVDIGDARVNYFRAGLSQAGKDPLAKISGGEDLQCKLEKLKPAHSTLKYNYTGVQT